MAGGVKACCGAPVLGSASLEAESCDGGGGMMEGWEVGGVEKMENISSRSRTVFSSSGLAMLSLS